jgi:hypothetical protein
MKYSKYILRWIMLTLCGGIGGQITGLVWAALGNRLSSMQFMLITFAIVGPATLLADLIPTFRRPSFLRTAVYAILLGVFFGTMSTDTKHPRPAPAIAGMMCVGALMALAFLQEWSENRFGQRATMRYLMVIGCGAFAFPLPALASGITLERLGVTGWPWWVAVVSSGTLAAIVGAKLGRRLAVVIDRLEAGRLERLRNSQ